MCLLTTASNNSTSFAKLALRLASTSEEMHGLRYKILSAVTGLPAPGNPDGLEHDEFDARCDQLIERDTKTLKGVGTYGIFSPQAARKCGRFYLAQEFDLDRLKNLRRCMADAGRACIHPDEERKQYETAR